MSELSPAPVRRGFLWAGAVVVLVHTALPSALADQLRLDALVQEGDLILEEAASLAPAEAQLSVEEGQLLASERALRAEVEALNQRITHFNAAMVAQNQAVQTSQTQCPGQTVDPALAEACDQRAAELREQANALDDERPQLRARQDALNSRVDKQNAWGRDFAKRKHAQTSNDELNQHDAEEWLGRAKELLASKEFSALFANAGAPPVCGDDQIRDISTLSARAALERIQTCLKAVKAASQ